jgi:hypothetical protein
VLGCCLARPVGYGCPYHPLLPEDRPAQAIDIKDSQGIRLRQLAAGLVPDDVFTSAGMSREMVGQALRFVLGGIKC